VAVNNLGPLDWRIPIVTAEGRPTAEFQRRWADQISNNSQIGSITLGAGPPPALPAPADGAQYADTSTNPYTMYIGSGGTWHLAGTVGANPTATAKDTAVNGTATTFMRSDAAPAVQKASSSQFGIVKVDGTTITESGGVISSSGGGGGPVVLFDEILGSATASKTYTIPSGYVNFEFEVLGRSTSTGVQNYDVLIQFNGDTGGNYAYAGFGHQVGNATFSSTGPANGATSIAVAWVTSDHASVPANCFGMARGVVYNYLSTVMDKTVEGRGTLRNQNSSSNIYNSLTSGIWYPSTPAAITSIKLAPSSGNFKTGTRLRIIGVP